MPLKIGNLWTYERYSTWPPPGVYTRHKIVITKDTVIEGHRYFYCNCPTNSSTSWIRVDSTTGLLLSYEPSFICPAHQKQMTIDSLSSKRFDTTRSCLQYSYDFRICDYFDTIYYWSSYRITKTFNNRSLSSDGRKYIEGIGLSNTWWGEAFPITYTLRGCIINGILYGDTSVVGINHIGNKIPNSFSLSQNYPNPFNPVTKIKFDIAKSGDVKLIIYSVLGRKITTLVNEQLKPGTYEVEWDASNYPGGVYFYKLITNDYTETRKMVLVK